MDIIYKKLEELQEYENNPRSNDEAVEYVANSIKEFGFKNPIIVDKDNVIVAGHTRKKASELLGLEEVPVIVADDLTEDQIQAYRLVDNKVAEFSEWNMELLEMEIEELLTKDFDAESFGFEISQSLDEEKEEVNQEKPEVEFTEELGEESNYIVLVFDNSVDWLQLQSVFDLKRVKALDSKEGYEKIGTGWVVDGIKFLEEIGGDRSGLF